MSAVPVSVAADVPNFLVSASFSASISCTLSADNAFDGVSDYSHGESSEKDGKGFVPGHFKGILIAELPDSPPLVEIRPRFSMWVNSASVIFTASSFVFDCIRYFNVDVPISVQGSSGSIPDQNSPHSAPMRIADVLLAMLNFPMLKKRTKDVVLSNVSSLQSRRCDAA